MFTRWENQEFNVTTMFAAEDKVAVFGDLRYKCRLAHLNRPAIVTLTA
jgi:hypothetical protein